MTQPETISDIIARRTYVASGTETGARQLGSPEEDERAIRQYCPMHYAEQRAATLSAMAARYGTSR